MYLNDLTGVLHIHCKCSCNIHVCFATYPCFGNTRVILTTTGVKWICVYAFCSVAVAWTKNWIVTEGKQFHYSDTCRIKDSMYVVGEVSVHFVFKHMSIDLTIKYPLLVFS